jgi:hypothetical protein
LPAKLLHTADVLLDTCYAPLALAPALAQRRRTALRMVLQRMLKHAKDERADALLIAGGLFDGPWVTRDTIAFVRETFAAAAPLPIFIAPGQQDPFGSSSPYAAPWPENVVIFRKREWQSFPVPGAPVVVHGRAVLDGQPGPLDFSGLECPDDGRVHVALAHGWAGMLPAAALPNAVRFEPEQAAVDGLHYLALGGHHATMPLHGAGQVTAYYSGAPEPHNFEETGPHFFLQVSAEQGHGGRPQISVHPVASALTQFASYTLDCAQYYSADQLLRAIRGLAAEGVETLARVRLQGNPPVAVREELPGMHALAADAFAHLELSLPPAGASQLDALARENTSLGLFVQRLGKAVADAPTAQKKAQMTRALEAGVAAFRGEQEPLPSIEEAS